MRGLSLVFFFDGFLPSGLQTSVGRSVCKPVGPAPAVYSVAFRASSGSAGVSAFWLLCSRWHNVPYSKLVACAAGEVGP